MEFFLKPFLEKGVVYSADINLFVNVQDSVDFNVKFLQKVIFKHEVLLEFKEVLSSACSFEPFTVKNDFVKKVIKRLCELLTLNEDFKTKAHVFCCLFQSFAAKCKGDESVHFVQFFIVLCHILGMNTVSNVRDDKNTEDSDGLIIGENFQNAFNVDAPTLSTDSFLIFKELLLCLSKTPVNLNSSEYVKYNKWLHQLLRNLAHSQPFQIIFLDIFLISADIDVKLLEGNLENVLCSILAQNLLVDKNFFDSYRTFLGRTLNIFARFQRIVKFITKFLSSIKATKTRLVKESILPQNITNEFSRIVALASNQQSLSLFDILGQNVDECFSVISESSSGSNFLHLSMSSQFLICFLTEVKLFAPSIAFTTLQAFIEKLVFLKRSLQKFGSFLFSSKMFILKNEGIVKSFLELCFYCGEIQVLVDCYKDSVLPPSDYVGSSTDCNWQCCLSSKQWKKLVSFVLKGKLRTCDSVCLQLALQKIRIWKLEKEPFDIDESTLEILVHELTLDSSKCNLLVEVPPEDLAIVLEVVTLEKSKLIGESALRQILESDEGAGSWLSNPALQESSGFVVSLFAGVLKEAKCLLWGVVQKGQQMLSWLAEEYFEEEFSVRAEALDRLPEKINWLLNGGRKGRKREEMRELGRVVEVFKSLPLPQMKEPLRRLGLSFAVGIGTFLTGDESALRSALESVCRFLGSDVDPSTCFDVGLCIEWLSEITVEGEANDLRLKLIGVLVRTSPNTKLGLDQMGQMIDSSETQKSRESPLKTLETRVVLYNELGKCWQRAKKRKSDNDLIGSYRLKLAKMIQEEAKELEGDSLTRENSKILFKVFAIKLNAAIKSEEKTELAGLMEGEFPSYFDFAVKSLKEGPDESSAAFLSLVLQWVPQLRDFLAENAILKMWRALRVREKVNWKFFCRHATEEEFEEMMADLLKMSKEFLSSESRESASNCFEIWISFFESGSRSKGSSCQVRLQQLVGYLHDCHLLLGDLPVKKKLSLMKFFSFCLTKKEVALTLHVLDSISHVIDEFLGVSLPAQDFHDLFTAEAEMASAILRRQFAWNKSKVHLTFVIFKRMLSSLMARSEAGAEVEKDDVALLSNCAFSLEKWVNLMVRKEKDFARTSAYFITALISSIASVTVVPAIKFHLVNCINLFLSISDSHTVAYLMRVLKPGYQQVFSTVFNQFKKYHKYSGKI